MSCTLVTQSCQGHMSFDGTPSGVPTKINFFGVPSWLPRHATWDSGPEIAEANFSKNIYRLEDLFKRYSNVYF
jgi:hypothetical protein